jgi:hypothetical protein
MAEVDKDKIVPTPSTDIAVKNQQQTKPAKPKAREVEKKKTFGERVADNFMNIDYSQIKDRLLFDWLLPEIISTLGDILRMGFSKDGRGRTRSATRKRNGFTPYADAYDERHRDRDRDRPDPTRQNFRKIRLEFYEKEDAQDVLDDLRESLAQNSNGYVTVRELYSNADLPTNSTMLNWVWYDLEDAYIERIGDNYVLRMPPADERRR